MPRPPLHRRARAGLVTLAVAVLTVLAQPPTAGAARLEVERADGTREGAALAGLAPTVRGREYVVGGRARPVTGTTLGDAVRTAGLFVADSDFTELVVTSTEGRGVTIPLEAARRTARDTAAPPVVYADGDGVHLLTGSGSGAREVTVPGAGATLRLRAIRDRAAEREVTVSVTPSRGLEPGARVRLTGEVDVAGIQVARWSWTVLRTAPGEARTIPVPAGPGASATVRLPTAGTYGVVGSPRRADGTAAVAGADGSGTARITVGAAPKEPTDDGRAATADGGPTPGNGAGSGGEGTGLGDGAGRGDGAPAAGGDGGTSPPPAPDAATTTPAPAPTESGEDVSGVLLSAPAERPASGAQARASVDAPTSGSPAWRPPPWLIAAALAAALAGLGAGLEGRGASIVRRARRSETVTPR